MDREDHGRADPCCCLPPEQRRHRLPPSPAVGRPPKDVGEHPVGAWDVEGEAEMPCSPGSAPVPSDTRLSAWWTASCRSARRCGRAGRQARGEQRCVRAIAGSSGGPIPSTSSTSDSPHRPAPGREPSRSSAPGTPSSAARARQHVADRDRSSNPAWHERGQVCRRPPRQESTMGHPGAGFDRHMVWNREAPRSRPPAPTRPRSVSARSRRRRAGSTTEPFGGGEVGLRVRLAVRHLVALDDGGDVPRRQCRTSVSASRA